MISAKNLCTIILLAAGMALGQESAAQQPSVFMADPTIFQDSGMYYLYGTSSNKGFVVYTSPDLKTWMQPKDSSQKFVLKKGESFGSKDFWAPQVFKYKTNYYMAYTADEQIAIAKASSPMGPFQQTKLAALSGTGRQIDPFLFFDDDGKIYLYHVKLQNGNRIFVSEMKDDLSDIIPGTSRECLSATEDWENTAKSEWPVTEGPTLLKHKETYYLIYAANDFRNKDYAVGYATSPSPVGPWKKYTANPVISRNTIRHSGCGHGDVFTDSNGKMHYVLHTHYSDSTVSPRATGMVGLQFRATGNDCDILQADSGSFEWLQGRSEL